MNDDYETELKKLKKEKRLFEMELSRLEFSSMDSDQQAEIKKFLFSELKRINNDIEWINDYIFMSKLPV